MEHHKIWKSSINNLKNIIHHVKTMFFIWNRANGELFCYFNNKKKRFIFYKEKYWTFLLFSRLHVKFPYPVILTGYCAAIKIVGIIFCILIGNEYQFIW